MKPCSKCAGTRFEVVEIQDAVYSDPANWRIPLRGPITVKKLCDQCKGTGQVPY